MTGPEIVHFTNALRDAYNPSELITLLMTLNRRFTDYVVDSATFPKQVEQLVTRANSESWIARLVYAVVDDRKQNQAIRTFLQSNPDWDPVRNPPLAHPCDAFRILGGKSFIGRPALRKFLKTMNSSAAGKKVLIVTSEHRKVGKTYSRELIDFLSVHNQPSNVAYVDLDQDAYDPGKLTARIARSLGKDPTEAPKAGEQQDTRWNQDLVEWLVPIPGGDVVRWIVLDGFQQKLPSEGVQDFIAQLAQRVPSAVVYRLLLLNYSYKLPLEVHAFVFKEILKPIGRDEVKEFFRNIHEWKHKAPPSETELVDYVDGVYERIEEYAKQYPEAVGNQLLLNMAVTDATEVILE